MADMKRNTDMTSDRMFLGALVNAYSSPVMEARISLIAMKTYLESTSTMSYDSRALGDDEKDERRHDRT